MQVALMVTMPWDKIEGSQTEPLVGRKLLDVRFGSKADIAAHRFVTKADIPVLFDHLVSGGE
jgi:hypothetical protein